MERKKVTNESLRKQLVFYLILGEVEDKKCKALCELKERWANICCADCRYFSKCIQKWTKDRTCYLLKQRRYSETKKNCSLLYRFFQEGYKHEYI